MTAGRVHRLHFSTPFSTNAVAVCQSVGLTSVTRLEVATRYRIGGATCSSAAVVATLHDRMTQCRYERPLTSLSTRGRCGGDAVFSIDVIGRGRSALLEANATLGEINGACLVNGACRVNGACEVNGICEVNGVCEVNEALIGV